MRARYVPLLLPLQRVGISPHEYHSALGAFDEAYVQDWGADPYVLGCYSYPAPGAYPVGGLPMGEVLAQSVNNRLFFGGEATSRFHKATLHGALEGGSRAAREIGIALKTRTKK